MTSLQRNYPLIIFSVISHSDTVFHQTTQNSLLILCCSNDLYQTCVPLTLQKLLITSRPLSPSTSSPLSSTAKTNVEVEVYLNPYTAYKSTVL